MKHRFRLLCLLLAVLAAPAAAQSLTGLESLSGEDGVRANQGGHTTQGLGGDKG